LAQEVSAAGLHVGLQDQPVALVRDCLGPQAIVGGTANTFAEVWQRVEENCTYIGVGPYRYTTTKANLSPILGLLGYQQILKQLSEKAPQTKLIAIGGIQEVDIMPLLESGLYGIALSGLLTHVSQTQIYRIQSMLTQFNRIIC